MRLCSHRFAWPVLVGLCLLGVAQSAEPRSSNPGTSVRVAGIVLKWIRGDKEANYRRIEPMIREAARNRAQIIVTTECFLDGYAIADKSIPLSEYRALGEPIPSGHYFKKLARLAGELNVYLVAGMLETDGEARYNTAVLIGPDGKLVGKYRKQKLGHEIVRNTPGKVTAIHGTPLGKLGILICADRTDPQLVRRFRDNGADYLICPSGGMFGPKTNDPIVKERSRENALPIVFVHPAEFLVTAPDGTVRKNALLGDALLIARDQAGTRFDEKGIYYAELPRPAIGRNEILIEVRENRGIARSGYPSSILVDLGRPVPTGTAFRMLDPSDHPVVAQFRPADESGQATTFPTSKWWVDFHVELAPFQTRVCRLQFGPGIQPGPTRATGLVLEEFADRYRVLHEPYLSWTVSRDLKGLLRSMKCPDERLRPHSAGLILRDRNGREIPLGGDISSHVLRNGKVAVGLRLQGHPAGPKWKSVRYTVDLSFFARVSWMEVNCRIEDPEDLVGTVGHSLDLVVTPSTDARPTLVDLGASNLVYAALKPKEQIALESPAATREPGLPPETAWQVLQRTFDGLRLFAAAAPADSNPHFAEGWTHLMDRERCLAMAIADFGRMRANDRLTVTADGTVSAWRDFAHAKNGQDPTAKQLRTWWHFVRFPPQQGAATSPQNMQSPPEVVVRRRGCIALTPRRGLAR